MYPSLLTRPAICPTITGFEENIFVTFYRCFTVHQNESVLCLFNRILLHYYLLLLLSVPKWNKLDRHVRSYHKSILSQEVS